MSSIGETLRRERLRQNLDLEQISRELKIAPRLLEAIEDERFDRLPAAVFAKSFVRQYAGLLGLDQDELGAELQRSIEPPAPLGRPTSLGLEPIDNIQLPRVEHWEAVSDRDRFKWTSPLPSLALLVVVLLLCSGVYTFWQHSRQQTLTAQNAPPASQEAAPPPPPLGQPEPKPPSAAAEPAPTPVSTPAVQTPPATPPSQIHSADRPMPAAVRVQLTATETVWVLARADGKFLFSGTLEPNDTRMVEAAERLTLRVGNAGGVTLSLNGKPIGVVGPKGLVRELQFTSGGFQIVAAPKPSLPEDKPI